MLKEKKQVIITEEERMFCAIVTMVDYLEQHTLLPKSDLEHFTHELMTFAHAILGNYFATEKHSGIPYILHYTQGVVLSEQTNDSPMSGEEIEILYSISSMMLLFTATTTATTVITVAA